MILHEIRLKPVTISALIENLYEYFRLNDISVDIYRSATAFSRQDVVPKWR